MSALNHNVSDCIFEDKYQIMLTILKNKWNLPKIEVVLWFFYIDKLLLSFLLIVGPWKYHVKSKHIYEKYNWLKTI